MSDEEQYFGFSSDNKKYHWVAIDPFDFYTPAAKAELDELTTKIGALESELQKCNAVEAAGQLDEARARWDEHRRRAEPDDPRTRPMYTGMELTKAYREAQAARDAWVKEQMEIPREIEKLDAEIESIRKQHRGRVKQLEEELDKLVDQQEELNEQLRDETVKIKEGQYCFKLSLVRGADSTDYPMTCTASARGNIYHTMKTNNLALMVLFMFLVMFFISRARRNPNMYLRRIAGLEAVDEAIGRATEMGKPVLFVHGLAGMDAISTIAAVNILSKIAGRVADYESKLLVPNYDPIVMSISQEVVKEAYLKAGRPDAYREDSVFFVTYDQFSYVSAIEGIMMREKPAANFLMGYFYAEALLLAETGSMTGAIQIAGTAMITQLPFFVAACDYTLIGEEIYAASAYLSREPLLLGSIKGQDILKLLLMALLVVSFLLIWAKHMGWIDLDPAKLFTVF